MRKTWTFGQRLAAGFAVVLILTAVMGGVGLYALRTVVEGKDRVILHTGQDLIDAERLRASMQREVASFRSFLLTGELRWVEGMRGANEEFADTLAHIRARGLSEVGERRVASIAAAEAAHQRGVDRFVQRRGGSEDLAALAADYDADVTPRFDALADAVREFVADAESEQEEGRQAASDTAAAATSVLIGSGAAALLLGIVIAVLLARTLGRQIGSSVQHIRSSSAELQAAATQQASGAKEQAAAMSEISTTIGELLATARQIAESGQHVAKMASDSAHRARAGQDDVGKARAAVTSIRVQVDAIVTHMLELGKKSQQIGGILEIINELAEQTNILAINATIEAAGAGDAGRRFAVVGEEIRKLADRVGGSTKEIRALIEEIRASVNATVMATETGSKTVEVGAQRFADLETSFSGIGDLVVSTMEAGREIELSTKQQSTAVEQVNVAISNVAQATKETETASQQTLQTAAQLGTLSNDLSRLVQAPEA
jgi:CHASE3 domain sensor protein